MPFRTLLANLASRFRPTDVAPDPVVMPESKPAGRQGALKSATIAAWPSLTSGRRTAGIVMVAVPDVRRRRDLPTDWRTDLESRLAGELPATAQVFRLPKGNGMAALVTDTPALILGAAARRLSASDFPADLAIAVAVAGAVNTRPLELLSAAERALDMSLSGGGRVAVADLRVAAGTAPRIGEAPRQFA